MIFQHTWEKVISGEKTQTRRIVKPKEFSNEWGLGGENDETINEVLMPRTKVDKYGMTLPRNVYLLGKTYAVQPGRGKKQIARIRLKCIRLEDVREISDEDVKAEGFKSKTAFWSVWCKMHDKDTWDSQYELIRPDFVKGYIAHRPTEQYQAWVLTFEVVK